MNLRDATVTLRVRSVAEIFDLALRMTAELAPLYRRLGAVTLLPAFAACLACRHLGGWSWEMVWLLAVPLVVVLEAPFTVAAGERLFSTEVSARRVLAKWGRRAPALLAGTLIALLLLALFSITIVLTPLAMARGLFLREAALLEGLSGAQSIARGVRLTRRHLGPCLLLLVGLLGTRLGGVLLFELLGQALLDDVLQLGTPFGSLAEDGGSPFALAGLFATVPLHATARFLKYIDLRTRKEGWDIQVRFAAIQAEAAGATA